MTDERLAVVDVDLGICRGHAVDGEMAVGCNGKHVYGHILGVEGSRADGLLTLLSVEAEGHGGRRQLLAARRGHHAEAHHVGSLRQGNYHLTILDGVVAADAVAHHDAALHQLAALGQVVHHAHVVQLRSVGGFEVELRAQGDILSHDDVRLVCREARLRAGIAELAVVHQGYGGVADLRHVAALDVYGVLHDMSGRQPHLAEGLQGGCRRHDAAVAHRDEGVVAVGQGSHGERRTPVAGIAHKAPVAVVDGAHHHLVVGAGKRCLKYAQLGDADGGRGMPHGVYAASGLHGHEGTALARRGDAQLGAGRPDAVGEYQQGELLANLGDG